MTPQKPQQKSALLKITALVTQLVTKLVTLLDIDVGEIRFQPLFSGELQYTCVKVAQLEIKGQI